VTPETKKLARKYLDEVIESGICSGMRVSVPQGGKFLQLLEAEARSMFGSECAVTFNSATSALHASLVACGIGPGDVVLVSGVTMSASGAAVMHAGATPYFIDVDPRTGNITPDTIREAYIAANDLGLLPPSAMIVVHLFGQVVDVEAIREDFDLKIIEDCAQAPGCCGERSRKMAGTMGDIGVFSLNQHKVIQCGEGGIAITDDKTLAGNLKYVRNHGENHNGDILGYNYRMTELEAAVGYAEISELFQRQHNRRVACQKLSELLKKFDEYRPMRVPNSMAPYVYYLWQNTINGGAPAGWRRGYSTPLCCVTYFKHNVMQSCLVGAHEFDSRIIVRDPPESTKEAEKLAKELMEVAKETAK
jgi:dTDP-4-amino-4,6-dideoxygalactose transaminase